MMCHGTMGRLWRPRARYARSGSAIGTASQHPLSPTTVDAHPAAAAGATTIATSQACPTVTLFPQKVPENWTD